MRAQPLRVEQNQVVLESAELRHGLAPDQRRHEGGVRADADNVVGVLGEVGYDDAAHPPVALHGRVEPVDKVAAGLAVHADSDPCAACVLELGTRLLQVPLHHRAGRLELVYVDGPRSRR